MNKSPQKTKLNDSQSSPLNDPIFKIQIKPSKERNYMKKDNNNNDFMKKKSTEKNKKPLVSKRRSFVQKNLPSKSGYFQSTVRTPNAFCSYTSIFYSKRSKKIEKKNDSFRRNSPGNITRFDSLRASLTREHNLKNYNSLAKSYQNIQIEQFNIKNLDKTLYHTDEKKPKK